MTTTQTSPLIAQDLQLEIVTDTLFKSTPVDSTLLNKEQKIVLKAGQKFKVLKYGVVDGHLKVLLEDNIPHIGSFGYVYIKHIRFHQGEEVLDFDVDQIPDTEINAKLWITQTTLIKKKPIDSSSLSPDQYTQISLGQTFFIQGYASTQGHFRVILTESIADFGNVGYVYWQHVRLIRDGIEIPYNPDAITMIVQQETVIKKQPIKTDLLKASEKAVLPGEQVYGIKSYSVEQGHIKVALTEEISYFGNTGYVLPTDVSFQQRGKSFNPIPPHLELNIPYFSQRDNPRYSWSTCNVTSIAMALFYHGLRSRMGGQLEDELLQWCFNHAGAGSQTNHSVLSALIQAYGFKTSFSTTRNWVEVKEELINRRPVVLAGDFTPSGHIVTLIGYNNEGYIVHDPWGDAYTNYSNTEGQRLLYSYSYLDRVSGPNGNIWAHFIDKK
ncbi:MAG: C39 family peptidase [Microcoleaceae cyanobacterium]